MDQRDDSSEETTSAGRPATDGAARVADCNSVADRLAAALMRPPAPMPPRMYAALPLARDELEEPAEPSLQYLHAPPLPLPPRDYGWRPPAPEPVALVLAPPLPIAARPAVLEALAQSEPAPTATIPEAATAAAGMERPVPTLRIDPPHPGVDVIPAPLTRSWLRQVRRAGWIASLVFAGWMAALCLLIVVYRVVDPPLSSLMLQQKLTGQDITQRWVAIEDVSPDVIRAVLLSEDGRFCQHSGIDFEEMQNAIDRARDGNVRGASTISMQVIKNLFLWPSKSYLRKAIEIPLTYAMEAAWPKQRIMEVYLNIAEWGPGIFGVEAASQHHFNKPASRLNEREAARLAVALPNPLLRDAGDPGPRTRRLASDIQGRMRAASSSQLACVIGGRTRRPDMDEDIRPAPSTADDDWDAVIQRVP